jgi:hypothetical protein
MGRVRLLVAAVVAAAALLVPAGALAFGPAPPPGNPDNAAALEACGAAVDRQLERGTTAGGGPKGGEAGPANCDHYWQDDRSPAPSHIGNGNWPPPPHQG